MDRKVLKAQLRKQMELALEASIKAVEEAPDGQWIAASEWQIRDEFQKLQARCYQAVVQARLDAQPSASQAAFSPSGKPGRSAGRQGSARGPRADRRR
jgi:hypothetical protein